MTTHHGPRSAAKLLLTTNSVALRLTLAWPGQSLAQSATTPSNLPPVTVTAPEARHRPVAPTVARTGRGTARARRPQAAQQVEPAPAGKPPFGPTQDARTGTVGVYTDSTATATKTNTKLVNIPQSVTVLSKDYIRDQSFQSLTDATRYVPGVAIHQGEGNRDELVIRGVDSSANFYARYDSFDLCALDLNTNIQRNRTDEKISPRAAVIFKPIDSLSIYTGYSISYLPASGDQFSALSTGTLILEPQKFENTEVGVKWNIQPKLLFTAAVYELNRTNVPIQNPLDSITFFPSGSHKIRGFETALTGDVTPDWQTTFGYAFTDARITSATSTTIVPGNRVQLVPYNRFGWWNKYQIDPRVAVLLGMIYFSDSYASSDDTVRLPGFVGFDAGLFGQIDKTWSAQLNIENSFNKGYWASADGNNNISPGQGRTIRVSAWAQF